MKKRLIYIFVCFLDHVTKNAAETNSNLGNTMDCRTDGLIIVTIRIIIVGITSVVIVIIRSFTKGTIENWSRCSLCTPTSYGKA